MSRINAVAIILAALLLLSLSGCDSEAEHRAHVDAVARMDSAAALMEVNPDSALCLLQAVDSAGLTDEPTQARFSLLMAQAIHKTSELDDMAIVQSAVDYYANHGTPTEQMLTDFYQGVVYKTNHQLSKALECYLRAEQRGKESTFWEGKGRVIVGQGTVYYSLQQWDEYLKCMHKALKYYKKSNDTESYYRTLYFVVVAYARKGDYTNERKYLEMLRPTVNDPSSPRQAHYYYELLLYYQNTNQKDSILSLASIYEDVMTLDAYDSLDLVHCYLHVNEPALARRYMPPTDKDMTEYSMRARWLSLNIMLCKAEGKHKEEAAYFEIYDALQDSIHIIEGRAATEVAQQSNIAKLNYSQQKEKTRKTTNFVIINVIISVILCIILKIYLHKHRANKIKIKAVREYHNMSARIAEEKLELSQRIANEKTRQLEETNSLLSTKDAEISRLNEELNSLQSRHKLTDNQSLQYKSIIAAFASKNPELESKQTDYLHSMFKKKSDFIKFAENSLKSEAPDVFNYFMKCRLTDTELAICALMRYGLTMKDIKGLIPSLGNNNVTSIIRNKLGLKETDPFLRVILFSESMGKYIRKE